MIIVKMRYIVEMYGVNKRGKLSEIARLIGWGRIGSGPPGRRNPLPYNDLRLPLCMHRRTSGLKLTINHVDTPPLLILNVLQNDTLYTGGLTTVAKSYTLGSGIGWYWLVYRTAMAGIGYTVPQDSGVSRSRHPVLVESAG